jgi:lysophospholipase L1-like esterase
VKHTPLFASFFYALLFFQPVSGLSLEDGLGASRKWEKEVTAFEQRDKESPPPSNPVVFVGSSSIRLWKSLEQDFRGLPVINRGFGGSQLSDAAHFVDRLVLAYQPRFIVVYSGGNDLNARRTPEQVFEAFRLFVERVREKQPTTPIAYISIAGNPKRWSQVAEVIQANALIEIYTKQQPHLLFIDVFHAMLGVDGLPRPDIFSSDNLHMNEEGYRLWTRLLLPYLAGIGSQ